MKHIEFSSVANVIRLILISCTASENVYFNNRCTVVYVENNKNKNFIIIAVLSSDSMFYYGDVFRRIYSKTWYIFGTYEIFRCIHLMYRVF